MGRSEPLLQYISRRVIEWGGSSHRRPLTTMEPTLPGMNGERASLAWLDCIHAAGQSLTDEGEI